MKTTKLFFMAALALMTAACSNDDNEMTQQSQKAEGIPFSATITVGNVSKTRALTEDGGGIAATWADGEKVALIYDAGGTPTNTEAEVTKQTDGSATISATLAAGATNGSNVTIIYPASAADGATGNVLDNVLTSQNGMLKDNDNSIAKKYDVRKGTGKLSISGGKATVNNGTAGTLVSLTNQNAIFKLTLKDIEGSNDVSATSVKIYNQTNTLLTTVTPASGYDKVMYVALPTTATTLKFAVTDGTTNYFNMASGLSLGTNFYQSTIKLATVGDVIMPTGKCAKAGTAGAVAMIAYLGNASDCVNGLAIALENVSSSSLRWDNSGSKNGGKTAAEWCDAWNESTSPNKVTGGTWRLPTIIDWQNIIIGCGTSGTAVEDPKNTYMKYDGLTSYLSAAGCVTLTSFYWSSTEVNVNYAMDLNFTGGSDGALFTQSSKTGECGVRACLAF